VAGVPLPITFVADGPPAGCCWARLPGAGFGDATGEDVVFSQLMLEQMIESASKPGSLRVLEEAGIALAS
jgi:hypothetical protein